MKIRRSSKSFRSKPSKGITTSSSDNLLFSSRELKQMHRSEIRSKILKVALPCLLVAVIGTAAYAMQSKAHHLPNNSLADTSSISSPLNAPNSTNSNSQSSTQTSTDTSESTNPASINSQTINDSNLQAQLNAVQAKATDSVNAAEAQANAAQAQDTIENNTINAEAQAANQAAAADQAAAQDLANAANANNTAMTPDAYGT